MQRLWTLLVSGVVCALLPATAQSQDGTSLYEPYPQPNSRARAERFVDQLKAGGGKSATLDVSQAELERGVVVNPRSGTLEPVRPRRAGPSARATGGDGLAPSFGWVLAAALLGIVSVATIRLSRVPATPPR
jgi:hypothetical protein